MPCYSLRTTATIRSVASIWVLLVLFSSLGDFSWTTLSSVHAFSVPRRRVAGRWSTPPLARPTSAHQVHHRHHAPQRQRMLVPVASWGRSVKKVGLVVAKLSRSVQRRIFGTRDPKLPLPQQLVETHADPDIPIGGYPSSDETTEIRVETAPESLASLATETPNDTTLRRALAAPLTDLSGTWKPIINAAFLTEYDTYLSKCGEGIWFRKTLLSVLNLAKEVIVQRSNGRELSITGVTPIGGWERTLVASGHEPNDASFEPVYTSFRDPDGDTVAVEAWWEGSVHKSWLRHKPRLLGGEIESTRYLESADVLVCESIFHPPTPTARTNSKFQEAKVVWKFQRQTA